MCIMADYKTVLQALKEENDRENEISKRDKKDYEEERKLIEIRRNTFLHSVRRATLGDYESWLRGYIETAGGVPTHYYDYHFSITDFFVLLKSDTLPTLYGANSVNIIVPEGLELKIENDDMGHNNVYYMKSYICGGIFIPVYENMVR